MRLRPIKPAAFCGQAESVALLRKDTPKGLTPTVMSESQARQLLSNPVLLREVPEIKNVSDCPVLIKGDSGLEIVTGYNRKSKVFAEGTSPAEVDCNQAFKLIIGLLSDFKFTSEFDQSRAVALLLSPALLHGGLIVGRAPMFVIEGDQPGVGKGTLANIVAAVYNAKFTNITRRRGGVGSFDESIGAALDAGRGMILFDNFRGKFDSQFAESLLTEPNVQIRLPYRGSFDVDVTRNLFVLTSNGIEMTDDLARRVMVIDIEKQPEDYQFKHDDIVRHVKQDQPLYLGAVFALIKHWYAEGARKSAATMPSYTAWLRCVDYIITNYLFLSSVLTGNQETLSRMANPALSWLREVALYMIKYEVFHDLSAMTICNEIDGVLPIPGLPDGEMLTDDNAKKAASATGMCLKKAFGENDVVRFGDVQVTRLKHWNHMHNEMKSYRFTRSAEDNDANTAEAGLDFV
ncbi:MAG: hypothetical protein JXR80_00595 [Deltaproteobacteria bacterium]|nr:hypothetical protein [Deltaproteobacteria bacterium]